jgi:peptidoglycan hydrolase-like protein with peptidoglycan-binding domain
MSCSRWALAEARRRGRLVYGAGERRWCVGRSRLAPRLLPGAVSAAKCAAVMVAAGMLIIAVEPARALAASGRRVGGPTAQASPPATQASRPVFLGLGSGYGGGHDAALVRSLQRRLEDQGYSPGPIDGRYGPRTETAVDAFQRARGLRVDGVAGPLTLAALRTVVLYPGIGYTGAGSSEVRGLQRQLRRDGVKPGPIDGRYGPMTEAAVRRFQAAHGLQIDGIVGAHTFGELERIAGEKRPTTPSTQRGHHAKPSQSRRPTPSHPVVPSPPRPPATTHAHRRAASRSPGVSWPAALVVLGLICLATLVGGVLLIDRRRRAANVQVVPSVPASGPVTAVELGHGDPHDDRPGDLAVASNRGVLLEGQGDLAGAEAAYREADAGGSAVGAFNLAGLLLDRGEVEEAMAVYRRADGRGDPMAAATLGMLLSKKGDTAAAEAAYRRADERGSADGAFNLGELLRERGDLTNAIAAYRRADERGDRMAALKVGMLLERIGSLREALDAYQRARQCDRPEVARSREEALALGISLAGKRGER